MFDKKSGKQSRESTQSDGAAAFTKITVPSKDGRCQISKVLFKPGDDLDDETIRAFMRAIKATGDKKEHGLTRLSRRRVSQGLLPVIVRILIGLLVVGALVTWWMMRQGEPGLTWIGTWLRPPLKVEVVLLNHDQNGNGIDDAIDLVDGARAQIDLRPLYRSAYYAGGYPPESEGVCTDLVWRAFEHAGFDLKSMVDHDIASAVKEYPRVENQPDPNIDFRRVPNLYAFFKRHAITLTNEVKPWDLENLKQWQPGDIVILGRNPDHIGIVSDMRFRNGVPKILHHGSKYPSQDNALGYWPGGIRAHFRIDPEKLARLMVHSP